MLLEGFFLPLTTPFYSDGRIYFRKLERNVASYGLTPAAGLAMLTATGEAHTLSDLEMADVLRVAAEAAPRDKVLLAGISSDSVAGSLALARIAHDAGYDALLVRSPERFSSTMPGRIAAERLLYFRAVADRSPLPLVLVNGREWSSNVLTSDLIAELSRHPQVIGLVESQLSTERLREMRAATSSRKHEVTVTSIFAAVTRRMRIDQEEVTAGNYIPSGALTTGSIALAQAPPKAAIKTRSRQVGFQILAGQSCGMLDALSHGASGMMPPFGICAPQACYEVYAAWKDGDHALATEKQARIEAAAKLVEEQIGIAALKAGCDRNGYFGGRPRLPGMSLTRGEELSIHQSLEHLRS